MELVAGCSLVLGLKPRAGAFVYTGLMAAFTIGVIAAMARGLSFECGCFGKASATTVGATKLAENLGMLVLGVLAGVERR